jgi:hypothetical protein
VPRSRNLSPTYSIHKPSGRGRLVWYDATGTRQQKLLPGAYGSEESPTAKATPELELTVSPTRAPAVDPTGLTTAEPLVASWPPNVSPRNSQARAQRPTVERVEPFRLDPE